MGLVQTNWKIVIAESDPEIAENLQEILHIKASRKDLRVDVLHRNTAELAALAVNVYKPFAISINPTLRTKEGADVEPWAGLTIIDKIQIPVPIIIHISPTGYKGANPPRPSRKVFYTNYRDVVSTRLAILWAESVLACLMERQPS